MKLNFTTQSNIPTAQFVNIPHNPRNQPLNINQIAINQIAINNYKSNMIGRIQNGGKCLGCNK